MSEYGDKVKGWAKFEDDKKYVVYFQSNSTALTESSEGTLYDVMQKIRQDKVEKVRVVAYTDSKGSPKYNQQLSMRRAESIKKRLSTSGADAIDVAGAGETAGADSVSGEKARRAEIFLNK
jgi:outer membrane protein OmpA-like peptidoglycan-associated protein